MSQHAPHGELPAGVHPTAVTSIASRDSGRTMMYQRYLRPGDLAFDIGANCGEVTEVMLALGARVVAVEPQAAEAMKINAKAEVVVAAAGAVDGSTVSFYEVPANPYLSTCVPVVRDAAVQMNASWSSVEATVPTVSLDGLIDRFGVPAFVKIDVEGFEVEVLRGLSRPVNLSFEVHSFDTAKIGACVELLDRLGDYGYLYSRGESYVLEGFPPHSYAWFGDVYATLRMPKTS